MDLMDQVRFYISRSLHCNLIYLAEFSRHNDLLAKITYFYTQPYLPPLSMVIRRRNFVTRLNCEKTRPIRLPGGVGLSIE